MESARTSIPPKAPSCNRIKMTIIVDSRSTRKKPDNLGYCRFQIKKWQVSSKIIHQTNFSEPKISYHYHKPIMLSEPWLRTKYLRGAPRFLRSSHKAQQEDWKDHLKSNKGRPFTGSISFSGTYTLCASIALSLPKSLALSITFTKNQTGYRPNRHSQSPTANSPFSEIL